MTGRGDTEEPLGAARRSGLIAEGEPLLVLLSGGADSVCLLEVCARLGARVAALHVNYGLRASADGDEALCRQLCRRLGLPLTVERVSLAAAAPEASGNLQSEAREARYGLAEALVERSGGDYAAAHTASDQAETVVYRLAVSPGRRALLGMEARRGRLVRPLLGVTRARTHAYCEERGLPWREDPTNADPRFARARVRHEVMPALRTLSPAVEAAIAETALLLRDEAEVLDAAVDEALARLGEGPVAVAEVTRLPVGLARLLLRRLAEAAAGAARPLSRSEADAVLALGARGGTQALDLGRGVRAVVEYGTLRFTRPEDVEPPAPEPVRLPVYGSVRLGPWQLEARPAAHDEAKTPGDDAVLMAAAVGEVLIVRTWRDGDRMRPVGLGGSRSLADLFTDRKVPRALRRTLPVVEARGEIAWVAGVAVGEAFARPRAEGEVDRDHARAGGRATELVRLSARRVVAEDEVVRPTGDAWGGESGAARGLGVPHRGKGELRAARPET